MTMHALADIIWCIGAVLVTLALDFLSRRFGGGRLRRHQEPWDRAPEKMDAGGAGDSSRSADVPGAVGGEWRTFDTRYTGRGVIDRGGRETLPTALPRSGLSRQRPRRLPGGWEAA